MAAKWTISAALLGAAVAQAQAGWRPAPLAKAPDPTEIVSNAPAEAWRDVASENLLLLDFADGARVTIELAPDFAPVHTANIRLLARSGHWRRAAVYRVQDNYVVQWGNGEPEVPLPPSAVKLPPAEYDRPIDGLTIRPLGYPDAYAPAVGHAGGWPVGFDVRSGKAWLTHCYAMVGVARDLAPDTGSGSELYAIIGHAPRHLDRNIALVGRVLDGFTRLTPLPRGTDALGVYKTKAEHVPIRRISIAADLPAAQRPRYQVLRTDSKSFADYILGRANRGGSFFQVPAGGVDLCNAPVPTRKAP